MTRGYIDEPADLVLVLVNWQEAMPHWPVSYR